MIKAAMVINTQGKARLTKFYEFLSVEKQQELIRSVFGVLCSRAENVSNFIEADSIFGPDSHLAYKHYATLYFVFVFDSSENELAMLDLIQVFVETLDKCFRNVCELDVVFNYSKLHSILDEIIFGGQVLETSSTEVMKAIEEICLKQPQILLPWSPKLFLVGEIGSMPLQIDGGMIRIGFHRAMNSGLFANDMVLRPEAVSDK